MKICKNTPTRSWFLQINVHRCTKYIRDVWRTVVVLECSQQRETGSSELLRAPCPPPWPTQAFYILSPAFSFSKFWFLCQALLPNIEANDYQNKWKVVLKDKRNLTVRIQGCSSQSKKYQVNQNLSSVLGNHTWIQSCESGSTELPMKENFVASLPLLFCQQSLERIGLIPVWNPIV